MPRTQISKPEYALITVAVAQKLTGSRTATPTARQLAEAQRQTQAAVLKAGVGVKGGTGKIDKLFAKARNELSGICGMGSDECGGFWDAIKDAVVKAAPAMPFVGPAAGLIAATAPLAMASKKKKSGGQGAPAAAPSQDAQPPSGNPDSDLMPVNAQSVSGEPIADVYRDAEDALIFGEGGGSSELGAAMRRSGRRRLPSFTQGNEASSMSPTTYRLAVIQRASRLSGGAKPSTRHMYDAQRSVDRDLALGGLQVRIPGAAPGRVTR